MQLINDYKIRPITTTKEKRVVMVGGREKDFCILFQQKLIRYQLLHK